MRENSFETLVLRNGEVTVYADRRILVFDPILAGELGYNAVEHAPYIATEDLGAKLLQSLTEFERRVLAERENLTLRRELKRKKSEVTGLIVLAMSLAATLFAMFFSS